MKEFYKVWLTKPFDETSVERELFDATWFATVKIVLKELNLKETMKVGELGCGWGRVILGLKFMLPNLKIVGFEINPKFCEIFKKLKEQYNLDHVDVFKKDIIAEDLPYCEYDAIYSIRVLHYFSENDRIKVLKKIFDALKPGGKVLISIPNAWNIYRKLTYKHAPLISILKIKHEMKNTNFKNLKIGGYNFLMPIKRFPYNSILSKLNVFLSFIPLVNLLGGLVYVYGEKER